MEDVRLYKDIYSANKKSPTFAPKSDIKLVGHGLLSDTLRVQTTRVRLRDHGIWCLPFLEMIQSGILHVYNRIVPIRHKYCLDHSVNKPEF